ncbi:MAG: HPr family phosphocarrier protein [Actinomycetaceae bacterium]|nr:HPr family phosphocarrier protein [Actinomycetaceae bacterium]
MASVAFIVVSQSHTLARGICEVVAPMAPDVTILPCGCHDEGLATATELLTQCIDEVLASSEPGTVIVLMADFGSARLAAQQVINERGSRDVVLGRGPVVEGTSAGVVAAQQGEKAAAVVRAIAGASQFFPSMEAEDDELAAVKTPADPLAPRNVTVNHTEGLDARPAAIVARMASGFNARINIDNADATSVLALMRLGIKEGDHIVLTADGPEAGLALTQISEAIENGLEPKDLVSMADTDDNNEDQS